MSKIKHYRTGFYGLLIMILLASVTSLFSFKDGEKLVFDVKYGFINAGQATLGVETTTFRDTVDVYQITSTARTNRFFDHFFKVRDEIESIMDKEGMYSHRFTKRLREGGYRQHRIHFYYPDQGFTIYSRYSYSEGRFNQERMDIPGRTQDILSAFYWVRTQELVPDSSIYVHVTADGRNYNAEVKVHPPEIVDTIWGEKECLILEPVLEGEAIFKQTGDIYIWVTNDEHKIPVKLRSKIVFGSFYAHLSEAYNVPYND